MRKQLLALLLAIAMLCSMMTTAVAEEVTEENTDDETINFVEEDVYSTSYEVSGTNITISSADALFQFAIDVNAGIQATEGYTVTIIDSITLSNSNDLAGIGISEMPFKGTFDGGDFDIDLGDSSKCLFGYSENAIFKNFNITNGILTDSSNSDIISISDTDTSNLANNTDGSTIVALSGAPIDDVTVSYNETVSWQYSFLDSSSSVSTGASALPYGLGFGYVWGVFTVSGTVTAVPSSTAYALDFTIGSQNLVFDIIVDKITPEITVETTIYANYESDLPQLFTADEDIADDVVVTYYSNIARTEEIDVPTEVGTYYLKITYAGNDYYNAVSKTSTLEIECKEVTVIWTFDHPSAAGFVYTGESLINKVTAVAYDEDYDYYLPLTISCKTNNIETEFINAGQYTFYAFTTDTDYSLKLNTTTGGDTTIKAATLTVSAESDVEYTKEYDGTTDVDMEIQLVVNGLVNNDETASATGTGTYNSENANEANKITVSDIAILFDGTADEDNYTYTSSNINITSGVSITATDTTMGVTQPDNIKYGDDLPEISCEVAGVDDLTDLINISYYSDASMEGDAITPTELGTYYIKAEFIGTYNYKSQVDTSKTLTILKGDSTIEINEIADTAYGDSLSDISYVVSGNGTVSPTGELSFTYYTDEDRGEEILNPTKLGTYYIKAVYAGDNNYNEAIDVSASFNIVEKDIADVITADNIEYLESDENYTGTDIVKTVTIAGLTENTDYTVTYIDNDVLSGEATITITGLGNYTESVEYNFNIVLAYDAANSVTLNLVKGKQYVMEGVNGITGWMINGDSTIYADYLEFFIPEDGEYAFTAMYN